MINKRKDLASYTGANNNTDFLYFYNTSDSNADNTFLSIISNISIKTHVDRIYFHCFSEIKNPHKLLFKALKDYGYISKKCKSIKRDIFKRRRVYIHSEKNIKITILYNPLRSYYPNMRIILDDPDIHTIDWFDGVCNSFGFTTKLSYVELAIDFSPFDFFLKEYLCRNIFLKYHRGTCCSVGGGLNGSFYFGNKSKNSKSVILYSKQIDMDNVLRLEFRFNRKFIRKLGLELDGFEKINDIDISRLVSFKRLNRDYLLKHLLWKHKSKLLKYDDIDRCLLINQLRQVPNAYGGVADEMAYMKKIRYINNHQRFFDDMPEVNEALFRRIGKVKFI